MRKPIKERYRYPVMTSSSENLQSPQAADSTVLELDSPSQMETRFTPQEAVFQKAGSNGKRIKKPRSFMGCVRGRNDLEGFLEGVFIAHLLRKRYGKEVKTSLLVHKDNQKLGDAASLFDYISCYDPESELKSVFLSEKADILYIPAHDISAHITACFSGSQVRTTGLGKNILSRILRLHQMGAEQTKKRGNKFSYRLNPKRVLPHIGGELDTLSLALPKGRFIWLSPF